MMLKKKGEDHEYSWLYKHDIGFVTDPKTLMYIFNIRIFTTSKGKEMASVYCWDGRQFFKIVIFANVLKGVKSRLKENSWYAVRLSRIEDKNSLILAKLLQLNRIKEFISRAVLYKKNIIILEN